MTIFVLSTKSKAADLVFTNKYVVGNWVSDSCSGSSQNTTYGISTGGGAVDYTFSWAVLMHPTNYVEINNLYHAGGNNFEMWSNRLEAYGLPLWSYQLGNYQNIMFWLQGDGTSPSSNSIFLVGSNSSLIPALWHNGFAMTNEGGWSANHLIQNVFIGGFPELSADGDFSGQGARNNATVNVGTMLAFKGVDSYNNMSNNFAQDFASGQNKVGFFLLDFIGHLGMSGQLMWAFNIIGQFDSDTNVATCVMDWSTALPVTTNNCVAYSITKTANSLILTQLCTRLPMAWDNRPGAGSVIDANSEFIAKPSDANRFFFMLQVTNLPFGTYNVLIDGEVATTITSAQLGAGWNMFTNTVGSYWSKRTNVLNLIRDYQGEDRTTHVGAGTGPLADGYGSQAGANWAAGLIGNASTTSTITNQISSLTVRRDAIHDAAQPVPVGIEFRLIGTGSSLPWTHK